MSSAPSANPVLLLLPGMDGTAELFGRFINELPADLSASVVRYPTDRLLADGEMLELIAAACGTSQTFVLVAESYSSPLAIQFAAEHPQNLAGLVLCAGFASSPVGGWIRFLLRWTAPILCRLRLPKIVLRLWLLGPDADDELLRAVKDAIARVRPRVLAARLQSICDCDATRELAQIRVPILYLQAAQDRLVGESSLGRVLEARPEIQVARIDGPHVLLQMRSKECKDAIVAFLGLFPAAAKNQR